MSEEKGLKKTPLNDWHRANGGKMVNFEGWEMPVEYQTGIIQEHLATRRSGGLFDVSHMGRFRFKGPDKIRFLQHVLTNNVRALQPWQSQYTIIQTETGAAVDDAFLYRFGEDDYLLVVNASNRQKDWDHFQEHLRDFPGVVLEDHSASLSLIAFQGPKSKGIIEALATDGFMPEPRQNNLSRITLGRVEVLLSRTGYTGEPNSFELFVPAEMAVEVWQALIEAGQRQGVVPVGLGARDTLRLEAAMPLYGHELGLTPDGQEIPIFAISLAPAAVSFSELKGDFVGRQALLEQFEALQRLRSGQGVSPALPRRIMPLALEDRGIARRGHEVFLDDRQVGFITSGTSVPYWKFEGQAAQMRISDQTALRAIALAYLEADLPYGCELEVLVRNRRLKARVVEYHGRSDAAPYFRPIPVGWEKPKREPRLNKNLKKLETLLRKSLDNHHWRQNQCINLIPSEMTPSPLVRLLSVSDPVGRYGEHQELAAAFGQEVYYYQGCDFIAWVEAELAAEMAQYLGCNLVEVRPVSGQMANMAVFSAMVAWKNRINPKREPARIGLVVNHHIRKGGHLSAQPMGALRDYVAKDPVTERFAVVNFPVQPENPYEIDLKETERLLSGIDPELIVFGKSMTIHREPVAQVKEMIAGKKNPPILMYDMAHVLGLIGPHFQMPFKEGADILTGSTHKTFFGPQRGIIGCAFEEKTPQFELWQQISRRAFPGMVSNHHLGTLLGLLAAAIEMNAFKDEYQPQVIANAKAFARALRAEGLAVQGRQEIGFTETHQVIVDVGYAKGPEVAKRLEENNIITNYQAKPDDEGFTASSALRLGVAEMTRFGMKEKDFEALAGLMAEVIKKNKPVKEAVVRLRQDFLKLRYCFEAEELEPLKQRLLATF
jgi:aminomethyltransferase